MARVEVEPLLPATAPRRSGGSWAWRQLLILSITFFVVFTAFSGVQNLESSLDFPSGVSGSTGVAIIYITFAVVSFFSPYMVRLAGPKLCILVQTVFLGCFVGGTWYPRPYTLYVAAGLTGFGAASMWISQGEYVTWYAANAGRASPTEVIGTMQGIFFAIFQMTQVSGNLISSLVLNTGSGNDVSAKTKTTLFLVYLACIGLGLLLAILFLRPKRRTASAKELNDGGRSGGGGEEDISVNAEADDDLEQSPMRLLLATGRLLLQLRTLLIVPLFYASGLQAGYAYSNLTGQVIKPALGEKNIGFVMIAYGAADAAGSMFVGRLSDVAGRGVVLFIGWAAQIAVGIYILFSTVEGFGWGNVVPLALLWGLGDAVSQVSCSTICTICFPRDTKAAFSVFRGFQALGTATLFFVGDNISLGASTALVVMFLSVGTFFYFLSCSFLRFDKPFGKRK